VLDALSHAHRSLGHLLFLLALLLVGLVVWRGRVDARVAGVVHGLARWGVRGVGGLVVTSGLVLWASNPALSVREPRLWLSLILWIPAEMLTARLVLPEAALVRDGGRATWRLPVGAAGLLGLVALLFGLMSGRG
jgi:hypothetical protein